MSKVPAPARREVAEREGIRPGALTTIRCYYCPAESVATWPLNRNGTPSYWPLFGPGFGLDHIVPQAAGGTHDAPNLVISCGKCNSSKRDRAAESFRGRSTVLIASPVSGLEWNGWEWIGLDKDQPSPKPYVSSGSVRALELGC